MDYKIISINSKDKTYSNEIKGTKEKYWININNKNALIKLNKYDDQKDVRSYNVSEKIFSEIAKFLGFQCVNIDFVVDENLKYGLASYDYREDINNYNVLSGDDLFIAVFGRKAHKKNEKNITKEDYCISNIIKILLFFDKRLIKEFNRIMIMDALTGENDRHYENWGIVSISNENHKLLPMYDNSSCLLHQFRDEKVLENIMTKTSLKEYVLSKKSQCKVSINGKLYNHFDFIDYLLEYIEDEEKQQLINDIKKLKLLTNEKITEIVNKVPDCLCEEKHKNLIIEYLIIRRELILEKVD